jgi:uncharacterized membrane protein YgaE (UPF0421/DUF939 family)
MIAVAEYTMREQWIGFVIVVGLMVLVTMWLRGGLGLLCVAAGVGVTWGFARGDVQPTDATDRSTLGLLFLGAIIGVAVAFLMPSKRGA